MGFMIRDAFKRTALYRETRYLYRSQRVYGRLKDYIQQRYYIAHQIKKVTAPLDRPAAHQDYSIHVTCSHVDFDGMLWAVASWHHVAPESGQVFIHEDGSLTAQDCALIERLFPHATLIRRAWADEQIAGWLADYPTTYRYRSDPKSFWGIKLVDPYFVAPCEKVFLFDSDVLWFQHPHTLLGKINHYRQPIFMDGRTVLEFPLTDGYVITSKLNSGLFVYHKRHFDLAEVEQFFQKLPAGYWNDQPGYTYVLERPHGADYLDRDIYTLKGMYDPSMVVKHYVSPKREAFWFEGVKLLSPQLLK